MNKITFPRVGYDGETYTQKAIEDWYVRRIVVDIRIKLNKVRKVYSAISELEENKLTTKEDLAVLRYFQKNTIEKILLCPPEKIRKTIKNFEYERKKEGKEKEDNNEDFRKAIADAFHYNYYRQNVLVELAKRLNVKVCPYCNMQYTLFAEKKDGKHKVKQLAKLQFDHFVNKTDYPMFSMSLYNLIPSCAVCNQGKHKGELPLALNPYSNDIYKLFHFEVKEPLPLLMGKKEKDKTEIDVVCNDIKNSNEVKTYDDTFHISTLYSRHKDIVQEIYDKTYIASSARDIAKILMRNKKDSSKEERLIEEAIDKIEGYGGRYLSELWYGTYLSEKDIEKRPLTKFIQDIKKQCEEYTNDKTKITINN